MLLTPQPVGIFPVPASHLLLPPDTSPAHQQALQQLLQGNAEATLPASWRFFEKAMQGEMEAASQAMAETRNVDPHAPLWKYNAFVLKPSPDDYASLRHELPQPLQSMLDSVAYTYGLIDHLPEPTGLEGELLALYLSTSAACGMESGNPSKARHDLRRAVEACRESSPLLAAILLAQHVELAQSTPGFAAVLLIQEIKEAIRLATGALNAPFLAGLWSQLGMALQQTGHGERGALLEAIQAYQTALQCGISAERFPEMYAMLQNNLGLCFLAMPKIESSHQLRSGVAVQSFRQALKIYTRELHPDMWASVNMNLANALQYLPSSHPEENLIQAVQTYDEVLEVRSRARDPVAYALVLVNQANALAHLGIFQPALEKVAEAYKLFQWHDQAEQATAARELMEQIHQRLGEISEGKAVSEAST